MGGRNAYEKGQTQSFYNDFFEIFDVKRRSVARYEEHVKKLNNKSGFIDLFWPGVLLVEQKSAGHNLKPTPIGRLGITLMLCPRENAHVIF